MDVIHQMMFFLFCFFTVAQANFSLHSTCLPANINDVHMYVYGNSNLELQPTL